MKIIRNTILLLIAAAALAAGWQYRADIKNLVNGVSSLGETVLDKSLIDTLRQEINVLTPPPLRSGGDYRSAYLTRQGVIAETNGRRASQGLAALSENQKLNQAAQNKVADMFARQYFEHESPDGRGPSDLAGDVRYEFIAIGENLALGNFKNDALLIQAWMDSPGHRENILNSRYSEIGVAVGRGVYQGKNVWLAVQEFGKPASACPSVDASVKLAIENLQTQLNRMEQELAGKKAELDSARPRTQTEYDTHNAQVAAYNVQANDYNRKLRELKQMVTDYNAQVQEFNECVNQ